MLRSNPKSLAFPAGTTSISADKKSSSSIPYSSSNNCNSCFLTASFSSSFNGLLPIRTLRSSPSTITFPFFCICFPDKWIKRSVIPTTGSSSFSPIQMLTLVPSFLTTTPCNAIGSVTHWYFLTPP